MSAQMIELHDEYYYFSIKDLLENGFHIKFSVESLGFYTDVVMDYIKNFVNGKYDEIDDPENEEIHLLILEELTSGLIAPLTDENFFIETGYDRDKKKFYIRRYIKVLNV